MIWSESIAHRLKTVTKIFRLTTEWVCDCRQTAKWRKQCRRNPLRDLCPSYMPEMHLLPINSRVKVTRGERTNQTVYVKLDWEPSRGFPAGKLLITLDGENCGQTEMPEFVAGAELELTRRGLVRMECLTPIKPGKPCCLLGGLSSHPPARVRLSWGCIKLERGQQLGKIPQIHMCTLIKIKY